MKEYAWEKVSILTMKNTLPLSLCDFSKKMQGKIYNNYHVFLARTFDCFHNFPHERLWGT